VKELAIKNHWPWFGSIRRCQKWVEANISKPELVLNRQGKKAYDTLCAPYIERNPNQFAANECWVGDHHQFDFFCLDRGHVLRPWLTAWQDMRSRMIVGWTISSQPNQYTILNAFRMGCKSEFGLPRYV
jgi:putative transposase